MKMLGEVSAIVARREPVIKTIGEVEDAFKEIRWHYQHQQEVVYNSRVRSREDARARALLSARLSLCAPHTRRCELSVWWCTQSLVRRRLTNEGRSHTRASV